MLHRLRLALRNKSLFKVGQGGGPVEVDETFVGGKFKNMHKASVSKLQWIRSERRDADIHVGKTIVMGLLDRDLRQVGQRLCRCAARHSASRSVTRGQVRE